MRERQRQETERGKREKEKKRKAKFPTRLNSYNSHLSTPAATLPASPITALCGPRAGIS